MIHDIKFDLNCIHRRLLLDLTKSRLDHASERTIGGSVYEAGIFLGENPPVNLLDELMFGIIRFKLLVIPSFDE